MSMPTSYEQKSRHRHSIARIWPLIATCDLRDPHSASLFRLKEMENDAAIAGRRDLTRNEAATWSSGLADCRM